jgi:cell division inhibitor SepF
MALRDTWHRALVYFGLAEDPDYHEADLYEPDTAPHGQVYESAAPRSATVSRISERRRSRDEIDDIFADDEPPRARSRVLAPVGNGADVQVHLVTPDSFNDAQEVADRFKRAVPVILNLQTTEGDLAKRLIDFASGLTYALDGGMQKIAEKTFLLTPRNVEVSAEERARLVEKGFFNQS